MSATSLTSLGCTPVTTKNPLSDLIGWLEENNYVVMHDGQKFARYFHRCMQKFHAHEETTKLLENTRVIYINVSSKSEILNEGEWDVIIEGTGFQECTCSLKGRVSNSDWVPHKHFMTIK